MMLLCKIGLMVRFEKEYRHRQKKKEEEERKKLEEEWGEGRKKQKKREMRIELDCLKPTNSHVLLYHDGPLLADY